MKYLKIVFVLLLLTASGFTQGSSGTDIYALLFSGCAEETRESFADRIRSAGIGIEPALIGMVNNGPSSEHMLRIARHAGRVFDRRQQRLDAGNIMQMPEELRNLLKSETRESYVSRRLRRYRRGMIRQAMTALGILGGSNGLRLLRSVRRDRQSTNQRHAAYVLDKVVE